jgi:hypothetical protein
LAPEYQSALPLIPIGNSQAIMIDGDNRKGSMREPAKPLKFIVAFYKRPVQSGLHRSDI